MKPFTSKKSGEPMAFFTLEDMTGTVSVTIFPSNFAQWGDAITKDAIVMVKGKTSYRDRMRDDDEGERTVELLADEVYTVSGGACKADAVARKMSCRTRDISNDFRDYDGRADCPRRFCLLTGRTD